MNACRVRGVWMGALALCVISAGRVAAQRVVDLPAEDRALAPDFEEVFSVGSFDGEEWETFGEVAEVAFDGAGNLYVFDRQSSRVVVVDPSGKLLREVGEAGDGPGELRMPFGFSVLRDGSIIIMDLGHRGYTVYGPDGTYQRSVSFPGSGGADGGNMSFSMGDMAADPRGGALFTGGGNRVVSMQGGPGAAPARLSVRTIDRITLDGDEAESTAVAEAWMPPRDERPTEMSGGGMSFRMSMAGPRTWEPGLHMGPLADGGLAFVDSTAYSVKVVGPDGVLQRVLRRPFAVRPVTEEMEEAEKERQLEELEAGGGPQVRMMVNDGSGGGARSLPPEVIKEMMQGRIDQMTFYPELPVIMDMATGWSGKIWTVRRGEDPNEAGPIDVLTPAGQYAGTFPAGALDLPSAFGPDGMVAFVETDEFDVPTVVVRRLPAVLR